MSANLRTYIFILILLTVALFILACWNSIEETQKSFRVWVVSWFAVTSAAFLAHNYWIFTLIVAVVLIMVVPKRATIRLPIYLFLLPALPVMANEIPGFGGMRFLFELSYPRLLALLLLLPLFIISFGRNSPIRGDAHFPSDKYAYSYFALWFLLSFRATIYSEGIAVTDGFRSGLYIFLDAFLPYYVISRYLRTMGDFKAAFFAILASSFVLAFIGVFEAVKYWKVYRDLPVTLAVKLKVMSFYGSRAGILRISTVFAGPIVFGYFLVIGYGALNFLRSHFSGFRFLAIGGVIVFALLATGSRGPWVGFVVYLLVFALASPQGVKSMAVVALGLVFGLLLLTLVPGGDTFLALLPWIGSGAEAGTVSYREDLFRAGLEVISKNPFLGSAYYMQTEEMEAMRQGQGIIDVVNTYLEIGMSKGLLGLSLFVGLFMSLLLNIRKAKRFASSLGDDYVRLGQSLLAILSAVLVIIATVSPIDYIPIYYWVMAGVAAGYINMIEQTQKTPSPEPTGERADA